MKETNNLPTVGEWSGGNSISDIGKSEGIIMKLLETVKVTNNYERKCLVDLICYIPGV